MITFKKGVLPILLFLLPLGISSNSSYTGTVINIDRDFPSVPKEKIMASIPYGLPVDIKSIKRSVFGCSGFGMRIHPITEKLKMHKGIDLPAEMGTPIRSTSYGVVVEAKNIPYGYGRYCLIQSGDYTLRYAHMQKCLVEVGDKVSYGQVIGLVGSSGSSTAPHLHYEVLDENKAAINPLEFIIGS